VGCRKHPMGGKSGVGGGKKAWSRIIAVGGKVKGTRRRGGEASGVSGQGVPVKRKTGPKKDEIGRRDRVCTFRFVVSLRGGGRRDWGPRWKKTYGLGRLT